MKKREHVILIQSPYFPIRYWEKLYRSLKKDHYKVSLVEYPSSDSITTPLLGGLQYELQIALKKEIPSHGKAHLIAHGWACVLVAYLATEFKDKISSVTLISPLGVHTELSKWEGICNWPIVGSALSVFVARTIWKQDFKGLDENGVKRFSQARIATILKANRILHKESQQQFYEDLIESDIPVLVLLGVQTKRYRQPIHHTFKHWRRDILMVPIKKGEHFLSNEQTVEVKAALQKFWQFLRNNPEYVFGKSENTGELSVDSGLPKLPKGS